MQRHSARAPWAGDGAVYRDHVGYLETLNRRLHEIAMEPVARPCDEGRRGDDIYLANADVYAAGRRGRAPGGGRVYYDELRRIAGELLGPAARGGRVEETAPRLKRFCWTPAPGRSPLDYAREARGRRPAGAEGPAARRAGCRGGPAPSPERPDAAGKAAVGGRGRDGALRGSELRGL